MLTESFTLNVAPDDFSDWLREYFFKLNQKRFPKDTHKIELYTGRLESDWIPKSGNFKHRKYKGEVRGINYTLDRINDAEIEVTLECDERLEEVQPYFDELVIEIKNRYKRSLVSGLDKINDLPKKIQDAIREINKIDKLRHDGDLSIIEACILSSIKK